MCNKKKNKYVLDDVVYYVMKSRHDGYYYKNKLYITQHFTFNHKPALFREDVAKDDPAFELATPQQIETGIDLRLNEERAGTKLYVQHYFRLEKFEWFDYAT